MLTQAQLTALAADINANSAEFGSIPHTSDGAWEIAAAYNLEANPAFVVWRGQMPVTDIEQNGFAWNQLDSVPAAKYRIWERLTASGYINPTKPNVRQGILDFCKDNSNTTITALRDSILPHLKRNALRVEKLFATGTGTSASPGTMEFEGTLSYNDVKDAMGW